MKVAKIVDLRSSPHKKKNVTYVLWVVAMVLTKLLVLIIWQYAHISNHYAVHLKLVQCYMLVLSQ